MFTKYLLTFLILNLNVSCAGDEGDDITYVDNTAGAPTVIVNNIIQTDSSVGGTTSVIEQPQGIGGTTTLNTNVGGSSNECVMCGNVCLSAKAVAEGIIVCNIGGEGGNVGVGGTTAQNTSVSTGGAISGVGGTVGIGGATYEVSTDYPDCDPYTVSTNLPCDNKTDYICFRGVLQTKSPMYCHYSANTWVSTSCVNKGTLPGAICVPDLDLSQNNTNGNTCGWCICDTKTNTWLKNNNDYNRQTCF